MISFDEFEAQLSLVMQRLYDPGLAPPVTFWHVLGRVPEEGLGALQSTLIQAIDEMRPEKFVPVTSRSWRVYHLLTGRFVYNLTQDEVAERIGLSTRHLRREQPAAIHLLARRLWEKAHLPIPPETETVEVEGVDSSLRDELLALQESAPGATSDIGEVFEAVYALARRFPAAAWLQMPECLSDARASIHPSALRQVLWILLRHCLEQGTLTGAALRCQAVEGVVRIDVACQPPFAFDRARIQPIVDIMGDLNGLFRIIEAEHELVLRIELLNVDCTVLVVDDNLDIIHLYQRYMAGTRYHLVQLHRGQSVFERVNETRPDVIVLDIMLPDVDGWDLLTQLTEHPETKHIPVIVCSVVSDPDLAHALGARRALSKPVHRPEFIRALDEICSPV